MQKYNKSNNKKMPKYKKPTDREIEFLTHSNWIEQEYSKKALEDSIKAWQYAVGNMNEIDVNYILTIHYLLLRRVNERIAGKIRTCNVFIDSVKKEFLSEQKIEYDIENWINSTRISLRTKDDSDVARVCVREDHIKFEDIHPFEDGNGRVGRILYNIQRLLLDLPIHVIREENKFEYYEWFQK